MEYTVNKLAKLAGVSPRTLRFYDEEGLLRPRRASSSGYRIYGQAEMARLQQILFYRELGLGLAQVKALLDDPAFSPLEALQSHIVELRNRKNRLDALIANAEKTVQVLKGETQMTDKEKFEGFKAQMIEENEQKYGTEIREKYGDETVEASNRKLKNMTPEQHARLTALSDELNETLRTAVQTGDPAGEEAQKAAALHKDWLMFFWPQYTPEAHRGLGQMYVDDERFTAYYEKIAPGAAVFLRDAINIYTEGK